jgi:hypothetical protein
MQSIVMLRLGGTCVVEFAHHSMSLPSTTTIWCNTVMQALLISLSAPTITEIEANLQSCFSGVTVAGEDINPGASGSGITHQVLMLDELAVK